MRFSEKKLLDDILSVQEPCLGAVFCSYTFDPAYFEDHVLRALLRLQGDPDEDPARYHEEASLALREAPVACFVDGGVRRPGKRLPYDLQIVRSRTFHPKLILALYPSGARLVLGSGNVTRPGFEQNVELFFSRMLRYGDPADAALLRQADQILGQVAALADHRGTLLDHVRAALDRQLRHAAAPPPASAPDVYLLSTFGGSLISQIQAVLSPNSRLIRVGVLAPFFEQDDWGAADQDSGLGSVLRALMTLQPAKDLGIDIGVPWEDAPLAPTGPADLDAGLGALWAWRRRVPEGDGHREWMEHLVITGIGPRTVSCTDSQGRGRRLERDLVEAEIAARRLWPVSPPQVFAPQRILGSLAAEHPLRLWLQPTATLAANGRPVRRPLHAKLLLLSFRERRITWTLIVTGSANASRMALGRTVEEGGNVEAVVMAAVADEVGLVDVLPSLVHVGLDQVTLVERPSPAGAPDLAAWITDTVYDAAARSLEITWAKQGPAPLGRWQIRYEGQQLADGEEVPATPTCIVPFALSGGAELTLVAGQEWFVPIRVADLAALPVTPALSALDLRSLLALLGRRVSVERLETVRAQRGAAGQIGFLDAVFGEGFGPTDVFRAWWGLAEDLSGPLTVPGFRHRLFGPLGASTVWQRLRDESTGGKSSDEVWVYGCELLKTLGEVTVPEDADTQVKQQLLADVRAALTGDLRRLRPAAAGGPWIREVARFYRLEGVDA